MGYDCLQGGYAPIVQVSYKVVVGKGTFQGTNANTNINFKGAPGMYIHMSTFVSMNRTIVC